MFVITTLGRQQQGHHEFDVRLSYVEAKAWNTEEKWGERTEVGEEEVERKGGKGGRRSTWIKEVSEMRRTLKASDVEGRRLAHPEALLSSLCQVKLHPGREVTESGALSS